MLSIFFVVTAEPLIILLEKLTYPFPASTFGLIFHFPNIPFQNGMGYGKNRSLEADLAGRKVDADLAGRGVGWWIGWFFGPCVWVGWGRYLDVPGS